MPHPIQIPRLGWSMEQGTFVGWLKQNGDPIKPGDVLFTLEGEKAIQEIEAVDSGSLHFDPSFPTEGDIVAVGAVIGYLLSVGEVAPPIPPRPSAAPRSFSKSQSEIDERTHAAPTVPSVTVDTSASRNKGQLRSNGVAAPAAPAVRRLARQLGVDLAQFDSAGRISEADVCRRYLQSRGDLPPSAATAPSITADRSPFIRTHIGNPPTIPVESVPRRGRSLPKVSPRAVRTAQQFGIDWSKLSGTGFSGRIRERDVLSAAAPHRAGELITTGSPSPSPIPSHTLPLTPTRRTIASRMMSSLQQTAPVTLTAEVDVTAILEFREQSKRAGASLIPSITDCFIKLVATALREHPLLNARWCGDVLEVYDEIHIGIAVETEVGLLVPVVRRPDRQSLIELAAQNRTLIEGARSRKLAPSEFQNGTFTITNLGTLGVDAFTPIINFPETAILGLGRVRSESEFDHATQPRHWITLSLTFDHRVLDGAPAARFLQTLSRLAADSRTLFEPTDA